MRHQRRNTTTPQPSLETAALFQKTVKLAYYRLAVEVQSSTVGNRDQHKWIN
jgi:hypothetical protein